MTRESAAVRESEQRFRDLFEYLPIPYQSLDIHGYWLDANPAMARLLGFDHPDELLGLDFGDYWDDASRQYFPATFSAFKNTGATRGELRLRRRDGSSITVILTGRIQHDADGRFQRTHCILTDISERRAMEQEIRALNADLERKVEERTAEALAANAAKSEFLAHMSHELRTPMSGIIGMAELTLRTDLNEQQLGYVQKIASSANSLLGILNDILDLSKIEAEKLQIEKAGFDLRQLIEKVIYLVEITAHGKNLALTVDYAPDLSRWFVGDSLRITQVLTNLLGNAVKFTAAGTVSLGIRQPVAGRLCFAVRDTGIGMTTEQRQRLFQAFTQADSSTTRTFGGTGLGLVISKRLVELMGGTIEVTSAPGQGSCFSVEIDAPECDAPDSGLLAGRAVRISPEGMGDQSIPAGFAGRRILLVDDSAINREIVIGLLKGSDLLVEVAENGQQAVERSQETPWDLILMDIQMPVMDGLEATRCIRAFDPEVPIIALTANAYKEDIDATLSAGMNEHLTKPISRQQLLAALRRYLKPMPDRKPQEHLSSSTTPSIVPAPTDDFPEIAGIDRVRATQFFEGIRALFLRLLAGFADDYADVARQTGRDLAAGDRPSAAMRMHSLRGIAGQLGALEIAASAGALERAIQQDASALDASIAALDDQVSALIAAIASRRRGSAADSTSAAPVSALADALTLLDAAELAGLRDALRAQNLNALRRYEALQPALLTVLGEARTAEIGRAIHGLRIDEALSLLDACGETEDRATGPGSSA